MKVTSQCGWFVFQVAKLVQIAHAERSWRRQLYYTLKLWVTLHISVKQKCQMPVSLLVNRLCILDWFIFPPCLSSFLNVFPPFHTVVRLPGVPSMCIHTANPAFPGICRQLRVHACRGGSDLWALHCSVHEPHQDDCEERRLQTCQEHWW